MSNILIADDFRIIDTIVYKNYKHEFYRFQSVYIIDLNKSYHIYENCIYIVELQNAMKPGKKCIRHYIRTKISFNNFNPEIFQDDFEKLIKDPAAYEKFLPDNLEYGFTELPSMEVFTPWSKEPKLVNLEKKKFTLADIKKMIRTGQIYKIVKRFSDSRPEAAGKSINEMVMLKNLTEQSSGWRCDSIQYDDNKKPYISIFCHTFDSNRAYINEYYLMDEYTLYNRFHRLNDDLSVFRMNCRDILRKMPEWLKIKGVKQIFNNYPGFKLDIKTILQLKKEKNRMFNVMLKRKIKVYRGVYG
jgi:hypothetical protein